MKTLAESIRETLDRMASTLEIRSGDNYVIASTPIDTNDVNQLVEDLWIEYAPWYENHYNEYLSSGAADAAGRSDANEWAYPFPDHVGWSSNSPELAEQVSSMLYAKAIATIGEMTNIIEN